MLVGGANGERRDHVEADERHEAVAERAGDRPVVPAAASQTSDADHDAQMPDWTMITKSRVRRDRRAIDTAPMTAMKMSAVPPNRIETHDDSSRHTSGEKTRVGQMTVAMPMQNW